MRFNWRRGWAPWLSLVVLVGCGIGLLPGCDANVPSQDAVFPDAAQRVEDNLLPVLTDESDVVLRNLVNFLTALPEICSTPLASLGSFTSSLPALRQPAATTFNQRDGSWDIIWQDVVLGQRPVPQRRITTFLADDVLNDLVSIVIAKSPLNCAAKDTTHALDLLRTQSSPNNVDAKRQR